MSEKNSNDIDLVNFDSHSQTDRIRENEIIERQKRAKRIAAQKRAERIRLAKINRIKNAIYAWASLIGVLALVVFVIVLVVSSLNKDSNDDTPENAVEAEIVNLVDAFEQSEDFIFTTQKNADIDAINDFAKLYGFNPENVFLEKSPSAFLWNAKAFGWLSDKTHITQVKNTIKNYPMFSNGYVWSCDASMKYDLTDAYLYDTNSSYISAVSEICLWENDTSFLYETDTDGKARFDFSKNMTVLEKVQKATDYFFDKNDLNGGGIRYDENSGLVYILTPANSGKSDGDGSNYWYNHRFGYLDCYNNIAFNSAMTYLSKLYTLMGQPENAAKYKEIADKNKLAINDTFWSETDGRYIGCKDADGVKHDLGFTFVNLLAVSEGIADENKTKSIISWLDGERNITTDTASDVYAFGFAPRTTTVSTSDAWWDYVDGKYPLATTAQFGSHSQNGGASYLSASFDIDARSKLSKKTGLVKRIKALATNKVDASVMTDREKSELSISAGYMLKGLFGISTDGSTLSINPKFPSYEGYVGVSGISHGLTNLSLLFSQDKVFVTAKTMSPVRLEIYGFEKGEEVTVKLVSADLYEHEEKINADDEGILHITQRIGGEDYLIIQRDLKEKNKK